MQRYVRHSFVALYWEVCAFNFYLPVIQRVLVIVIYFDVCTVHLAQFIIQINKCTTYTGCPRRKGENFGRVFLMLKYTDITQNTYIQS